MDRLTRQAVCDIDDIQSYEARGCYLHPLLREQYLNELEQLKHKGLLCLTPSTILVIYHHKRQAA